MIRAAIPLILFALLSPALGQGAPSIITPNPTVEYEGYNAGAPTDLVSTVPAADPGAPFTQALRIKRGVAGVNVYDAAVIWPTRAPVTKGDVLLATYWMRRTKPSPETLKVEMTFQLNQDPFTASLLTNAPVDGAAWRKYAIPFRAETDFAAGEASLQVRYGLIPDEFEIGGMSVENLGQLKPPFAAAIAARFAYYYPGRDDPNAPWRTRALANIEKNRKGDFKLRVLDRAGSPVKGAVIDIRQVRTSFYWASAIESARLLCSFAPGAARPCYDTFEGRPFTPADQQNYRDAVRRRFNAVGFENNVKWPSWEGDRQLALDGFAWLAANNVRFVRGHNLIWPGIRPEQIMPADITAAASPAYVRRRINAHFTDILTALNGRSPEWDVVNEPFDNYDIQGRIAAPGVTPVRGKLPATEIATWFKNARLLDPKAKLFLNDYGVLENSNPTKAGYDASLIALIEANGGKVDGMGFQAHFSQSAPDFRQMQRVIAQYSPLVEKFAVTEYDAEQLDEELQADITEDMMTFTFGNPRFSGFEMWGFWDADHWLLNSPVFASDWRLKPSGRRWINLTTNAWRTRPAQLTTDSLGATSLRGFLGDYKITVTISGKKCAFDRSLANSGTFTLTAC